MGYCVLSPNLETAFFSVLQFKYRGRFNIVVDILDLVMRDPKGKTRNEIMEKARLSYNQSIKYLDVLLLCDFLAGKNSRYGDREVTRYVLTEHGYELVKQLKSLYFTWSLIRTMST